MTARSCKGWYRQADEILEEVKTTYIHILLVSFCVSCPMHTLCSLGTIEKSLNPGPNV